MQDLIRVCLKGKRERPLTLQFSSTMKLSQLAQFLGNCNHSSLATLHHPIRTIFCPPSHILADYLFTSAQFLLEDLAEVAHLAQRTLQVGPTDSKRLSQIPIEPNSQNQTIFLTFDSIEEGESLSYYKEQQDSYSFENLIFSQHPQSLSFQSGICFDSGRGIFLENFEVNKSGLVTFEKLERLLLIRKRLLQYGAHYFQLFGDLVEVKENLLAISFSFSYVPSVTFRDILSQESSLVISEVFVNKIWAIVSHMRNNGFQGLIYEILSNRRLKHFLDGLFLGIDGRLYLKDLNLVCQSDKQGRLTATEEKELFEQIKAYVKLNLNSNKQTKGESSQNRLSISLFFKLFLKKYFTLIRRSSQNFTPQTELFTWKKKVTAAEAFNLYEAVTAKKQKGREVKKPNQMTKAARKRFKHARSVTRDKRERMCK